MLPVFECSIDGVTLYLLFYVRLHALTITATRCFCVVAHGCSVCPLVAVWYSAVRTHVTYLPTLLLVGVPVFHCYNSAVTSLLTRASGEHLRAFLVGIHLGEELLGQQMCTCSAPRRFINFLLVGNI